MREEAVQTRLLQEHSRILQVSRTTSLTIPPDILHVSFGRKLRSHAAFGVSDKTKTRLNFAPGYDFAGYIIPTLSFRFRLNLSRLPAESKMHIVSTVQLT